LGQLLSSRAAERQQANEAVLRQQELWAQFAGPTVAARAEAIESVYDLLQRAIESDAVSMTDYSELRQRLVYLPPDLSRDIIAGLQETMSATSEQRAPVENRLKGAQARLRIELGLDQIDAMVAGQPWIEQEAND
jgi:hypothetical protein